MTEVKKNKVTVCIKTDSSDIGLPKVKEIVQQNGVQVSNVVVNYKNGDVFGDIASAQQRDKLVPLLINKVQGNSIINVKSKRPIITIHKVVGYVNEDDFIEKVKSQNKEIAEKIVLYCFHQGI